MKHRVLLLTSVLLVTGCGEKVPLEKPETVERDLAELIPSDSFGVIFAPKFAALEDPRNREPFLELVTRLLWSSDLLELNDALIDREKPLMLAWSPGSFFDPSGVWTIAFHASEGMTIQEGEDHDGHFVTVRGRWVAISERRVKRHGGESAGRLVRELPSGDLAVRLDLDRTATKFFGALVTMMAGVSVDRDPDAYFRLIQGEGAELFPALEDLATGADLFEASLRREPKQLRIDWRLVSHEPTDQQVSEEGDLERLLTRLPDLPVRIGFHGDARALHAIARTGLRMYSILGEDRSRSDAARLLRVLMGLQPLFERMRGTSASAWDLHEDRVGAFGLVEVDQAPAFLRELAGRGDELLPELRLEVVRSDLSAQPDHTRWDLALREHGSAPAEDSRPRSTESHSQPLRYHGESDWVASALGTAGDRLDELVSAMRQPSAPAGERLRPLLERAGEKPLFVLLVEPRRMAPKADAADLPERVEAVAGRRSGSEVRGSIRIDYGE